MSAPHHLPQRHLNLISSHPHQTSQFGVRPSIAERFSQLLFEIESFLLACTHEEMCSFWNAIANLRQYLQKNTNSSEVPHFLNGRKQQRDFCRILEVLADLPYPHLHLSTQLPERSDDRRQHYVYPHLVTQR
ncbi:hypothetical protein PseudUWO311_16905 [Pseudanabaena sp. UWO311]|jgi:hypothetical protein|uniref:hypothetical protein n=1 Tax=Pseudanabaena sp. UWO311 TaxID=2487337 RepID=UPI00115716C2|nr:hypothetical protein [Pseudanabaena sp. UWO311]TYQ25006.1 hypothetical protein PseudUWO311_16905 [Pseudanabaena sp. UWO311]